MLDYLQDLLYNPTIGRIIAVLVGIIVIMVLVRFSHRLLGRSIDSLETRYRARKFASFLGYLVGALLITVVFSEKLGGLTVAFGVAGAGIAFALQEVIASVAGWMAISLAHFYKMGDRVQVGGIKGDVIDVGILRTTLMEIGDWVDGDLYNGRVVRVANSFVFKEPVFNYSGEFPFLWDEVKVPIRYNSNVEQARSIICDVAEEIVGSYADEVRTAWSNLVRTYPIEDAQLDPMVSMTFTDNWIEFTLRYVVNTKNRRGVKDRLSVLLLERITASGDDVRLASATFELVGLPGVSVVVDGGKSESSPTDL